MEDYTEEMIVEKIQTIDDNLKTLTETLFETNNKLDKIIKIMAVK